MNSITKSLNFETVCSSEFPEDIIRDLSRRLVDSVVRTCYSTVRKRDTLIYKGDIVGSLSLIRYIVAEFEFDLSKAEIHFKDGSLLLLNSVDEITNFYLVLENSYSSIKEIKMHSVKNGQIHERAIFVPRNQEFICTKNQPINLINERGSTGIVPFDGKESILTSGGNGGSLRV